MKKYAIRLLGTMLLPARIAGLGIAGLGIAGLGCSSQTAEPPNAPPTGVPAPPSSPAGGTAPTPAGAGAMPMPPSQSAFGEPSPTEPAQTPPGAPTMSAQPEPPMTGDDGAGGTAPAEDASATALSELGTYLVIPRSERPELSTQPFASVPLTADDARQAAEALWEDRAAVIAETRAEEHAAQRITLDGVTLRYETVSLGGEPPTGRSLFISMHGGGSGPASVNDSQWQNQVSLAQGYGPEDALWVAPRAPTDDWNMWFKDHIDDLFDRLISNMVALEGVDPTRVYLTGYSAGGDGVYGLAPRTADRWAGAGMSAGHPNGVSVANMRNVAFALHAGGNDTAFDRHLVTQEYLDRLDALQDADPEGYPHEGMVHPGRPHWLDLADAASIPFLQAHTRSAVPTRVVWEQHARTHARMYWLAVDPADGQEGTRVVASYAQQSVTLEEVDGLSSVRIRMSDAMFDLDQPVRVIRDGTTLFEGPVERTIAVLHTTLDEREDPSLVYAAELSVDL